MLLYAYDESSNFHLAAKEWFEKTLLVDEVFFSWHTITGFLRISTNPRILTKPASLTEAVSIVTSWLALENTHLIYLEKKNWPLFSKTLLDAQANGNLVMDAHLAALAASCGATLASTDRDFSRFQYVKVVDPIKS
jgi:toxin-antitoxin system PIN domain toxin